MSIPCPHGPEILLTPELQEQISDEKARMNAAYQQLQKATANDQQIGGSHYVNKAIQPWDYIAGNNIGYLEGCAIKYLSRWKEKGGVADLRKARHYVDKLIELEMQEGVK